MITQVTLRNFKSFSDATVPTAATTLLVGANAVGKSNFFDALRFLKYMGEGRTVRDAIEGHTSFGPTGTTVAGIRGGAAELPHMGSDSSEFTLVVQMSVKTGRIEY